MTPKDKAQELVDRYYFLYGDGYLGSMHKQCALIAVDEIIIALSKADTCYDLALEIESWQEVKQQISNL